MNQVNPDIRQIFKHDHHINGLFYDSINSALYYTSEGHIYQHNIKNSTTNQIHTNLISRNVHYPSIPKLQSTLKNEVYLSPSRLIVVNSSQKEQVISSSVTYSKGVHYWEFYCPLSLYGISFGVFQEQNGVNKYEMLQFSSSSHRTVSIKLDLQANKLTAWVNKTLPSKHTINLNGGAWTPCIKIKGKGNCIIFNPYSSDPQNKTSIYNPFNSVQGLEIPEIKIKQKDLENTLNQQHLAIQSLNQNQFILYTKNSFKLLTRNSNTNKFDFDWFQPPTTKQSLINLGFTSLQLKNLNQYLHQKNLKILGNEKKQDSVSYFETSLSEWFNFFKSLTINFQNNNAPLNVREIILTKLEKIRPYLYILQQNIQPFNYSKFNSISEWRQQNQHRFFETPLPQFTTSISDITNYLPAIQKKITRLTSTRNFVVISHQNIVSVYNTQIYPYEILSFEIDRVFKKQVELKKINEISLTNLLEAVQAANIYKILTNCIQNDSQKKQVQNDQNFVADPKLLSALINKFKFSENDARQALQNTKNESIDEAVAYHVIKNSKSQKNIQYKEWQCIECTLINKPYNGFCEACGTQKVQTFELEASEQIQGLPLNGQIEFLSILQTDNSISPLLLAVKVKNTVRLVLIGPNPQYYSKFYFKEDKGFISFTTFEYLEHPKLLERESIAYMDHFFGSNQKGTWIVQDQLDIFNKSNINDVRLMRNDQSFQLGILSQNKLKKTSINLLYDNVYNSNKSISISQSIEQNYQKNRILYNHHFTNNKSVLYIQNNTVYSNIKSNSSRLVLNLQFLQNHQTKIIDCPIQTQLNSEKFNYIPLLVHQGPPGCNMNYPICSILYPTKGFLANYPYKLVFKHLHDKFMKINRVVIDKIGKNKNVKQVKEGLIWLSDSENGESTIKYRFKFGPNQKRIIVNLPETTYNKYLIILPIYENGINVNLPFQIGFVGVTGESTEGYILSKNELAKIEDLLQQNIQLHSNNQKIGSNKKQNEIKSHRQIKVVFNIQGANDFVLKTSKPFRLISKNIVYVQNVVSKSSIEDLIKEFCKSNCKKRVLIFKQIVQTDPSELRIQSILKVLDILLFNTVESDTKKELNEKFIINILASHHKNKVQFYLNQAFNSHTIQRILPVYSNLELLLSNSYPEHKQIENTLNAALDLIQQNRSPLYKQVRKNKISHLLLQNEFYSDFYLNLIEKKLLQQNQSIFSSNKISNSFIVIKEKFLRTIVIDLKKNIAVKNILLIFEKSELKSKMRLQIFKNNKQLIYSSFYQDHSWMQLTKNPYTRQMKKLFAHPIKSGLNCLGISLGDTNTRYLTIQISHTIVPVIGDNRELQNIPFIEIIPEVFGEILDESGVEIQRFGKYFDVKQQNMHYLSKVNLNNLSQYEKYSVIKNNFEYHLYDSLKKYRNEQEIINNVETLQKKLALKNKQYDWINSLPIHQNIVTKSHGHIGIDYYYTIVIKLFEKFKVNYSHGLLQKIYRILVVGEIGPIQQKAFEIILENEDYYIKCLPLLSEELFNVFSGAKFPETKFKQYLKSKSFHEETNSKLLIQLIKSQKNINLEDWLEFIILIVNKSNQHEECGKILSVCNWSDKKYVKEYLVKLSSVDQELFKNIIKKLDTNSLIKYLYEVLKKQSKEYVFNVLRIVLNKISEIKSAETVDQLMVSIIHLIETADNSSVTELLWQSIYKLSQFKEISHENTVSTLSLYLNQSEQTKLEFINIIKLLVSNHNVKVTQIIVNYLVVSKIAQSESSRELVNLLIENKSQLNESNIQDLLQLVGTYLTRQCSYGGTQGIKFINEYQLTKLKWLNTILDLITISSGLIKNIKEQNIDGITNLIYWFLLNNSNQINSTNPAYRTPSYEELTSTSLKVINILNSYSDKKKSRILKATIQIFTNINKNIKNSTHLIESTRHILIYRLHKGTNQLLQLLLTTQLLTELVCEYSLFNSMVRTLKEQNFSNVKAIPKLQQVDLITKFKLEKSLHQNKEIKDWSIYKNGNLKSSLLNILVESPRLVIKSDETIFASKILIAFLSIDTPQKNNIYPASVSCSVGDSLDMLNYIGTLDLVEDQFYSSFLTRVYAINLNRLKVKDGKANQIQNIRNRGFKYLEFKVKKPNLTSVSDVIENPQKSTKNQYYSVSFVSILGCNQEPKSPPSFVDTHLKLLSYLSQPRFKESLKILISKDFFHQNFSQLIEVLAKWISVQNYTKLITNILIEISEYSQELGNKILDSFFTGRRDGRIARLAGELTIKNIHIASSRLLKYHEFILQSVPNMIQNYNQFKDYIEVYLKSLQICNLNFQRLNLKQMKLSFTQKNIDNILKVYLNSHSSFKSYILRLFNSIMLLKGKISIDHNIATDFVKKIWTFENRADYYELISTIILSNESLVNWIIQNNDGLSIIVKQLLYNLDKKLPTFNHILLLTALSINKKVNQAICKNSYQILIFKGLTDTKNDKTLLKPLDKQSIKHIVTFFQNTCIGTEAQSQFTLLLKQLLTDLPTKYSTQFIYEFFIPLINSYKTVGVILYPFQRSAKRYISQPNKVLQTHPIQLVNHKHRVINQFKNAKNTEQIFKGIWKEASSFVFTPNRVIYAKNNTNKLVLRIEKERLLILLDEEYENVGFPTNIIINNNKINIQSITSTLLLKSEFEATQIKNFTIQADPKYQLLTNELLLKMDKPILMDSKYLRKYSPVNPITQQIIYYVPEIFKISDLLKQINIAGLTLSDFVIDQFNIRQKQNSANLDKNLTIKQLTETRQNLIVELEYDAEALFQYSSITEILKKQEEVQKPRNITSGLFDSFEKQGGVNKIIEVVIESISIWKNKQRAKNWLQYVQQLKSFSSLSHFFQLYMKKPQNVQLLFNLLAALPDKQDEKKWVQKEKQSVKFLYKIVAQVFVVDDSSAIRQFAIKNNFFGTILERLHIISKENKRSVQEVQEIEQELPNLPELAKKASQDQVKKTKVKKKGIGYGTDSSTNQKWDITTQELNKKSISEQIMNIINILDKFLDFNGWLAPKKLAQNIYQSALLPIIESALRGGSLLQIGKDIEVFKVYLSLIRTISKHSNLIPTLLEIPKKYVPKQTQSILSLLKNLQGTSKIFISCLTANTTSQNKASEEIAKLIIQTYTVVEQAVEGYNQNKQQDNQQTQRILELPLHQKYKIFLKDLRFDYISMKDNNNKFKHHYAQYYTTNYTPPVAKTIRLAQQLADVSTALPIEHTNSIFIRCDKQRVDYMQALIMGSNGTPYGHGAFLFDIYFEDTYPNVPPKVNLTTTGNGKIRFNPNLYACGKVCLSLLGTWRGNATQNWDAKVSTLLQVLVSIQSIIMAEQIYFNEPGFQHEQGTDEGERKNEAYSNIVRYGNVKFAMIDNIKNPPKGFETIIKRHFYLKKEQILQQCRKWIKYAGKRQASYNGLVSDHNHNWCNDFKKSKTKYKEMLEQAVKQLQIELNKLTAPSPKDLIKTQKSPGKKKRELKIQSITKTLNIQQVDVSYNQVKNQQELQLDINDEKVKDRWSRYIGAMGIDAVSKQSKANIVVFGLGALAIEVVKNLVLSGCKRISLIDQSKVTWKDLAGQFFFTQSDVGKNRIDACLHKIQELNHYVRVQKIICDASQPQQFEKLKEANIIIVTEQKYTVQIPLNKFCRENKIKFISIDTYGPYARLFNDFGTDFEVLDKNGEDPVEVMLQSITRDQKGVVTLLKGTKHPYEDGDFITINGVEGMNKIQQNSEGQILIPNQSINGTIHKIRVINSRSFQIGDTRNYSEYIRNGLVKNIKIPIKINFNSLEQSLQNSNIPIDENLAYFDFSKAENMSVLHYLFRALDNFRNSFNRLPAPWYYDDSEKLLELYKKYDTKEIDNKRERFVREFSFTSSGTFAPICAFFGGYAAQEAVKAITGKYKPTNSMFYCDFSNIIPTLPDQPNELKQWVQKYDYDEKQNRVEGLRRVIGDQLLQQLQYCRLFMIGSGAIGCELLKNYAMLNLGVGKQTSEKKGGLITLTDPDHIEVSNLNRQFLFREKHIRKPKSSTAAASAIQMNPNLKGHIVARLQKISDATKDIFSDKFFQDLTIVTNALDNVAARRYVDSRCVQNKVALLQSGTLGPKGHVQVVIPYKTQSYGSKQDPAEQGEIPHCTLKLFPQQTLHCIQWARDKFGEKFTLKPKALLKIIQSPENYKIDSSELKTLKHCLKLVQNQPNNFEDTIAYAVKKFYKYYRNDIKQLLYTYPLDAKLKDGQPFWKLPKRPPTPIEVFDPQNILHCEFITSLAVLVSKIYNIPYPKQFRTEKQKKNIGLIASKIKVQEFVPSDKKAQQINQQIAKQHEKKSSEQNGINQQDEELNQQEILLKIKNLVKQKKTSITAEEFQKDQDDNGHIDLIYAMANLRAKNYSLDPIDWINTKLKAGRIVPALSTTTTCIAGLQTYQLCKYLKKVKIEDMRNSFINLAVPIMNFGEPGQVQKIKLTQQLTVTQWDRWQIQVSKATNLAGIFEILENKYKLKPRDIIQGSVPIYFSATMQLQSKKNEREQILKKTVQEVFSLDNSNDLIDITVTFAKQIGGELLKNIPTVRLLFK